MLPILTFLIDTLFPPHEETRLVRQLQDDDVRVQYDPQYVKNVLALTSFGAPLMRALIHEAKFRHNTRACELLALLVLKYHHTHTHTKDAVYIPIPLSPSRLRLRGYNQVSQVLTAVKTRDPHILIDEHLLVRQRHTRPQTELTREERLRNLVGAFSVTNSAQVKGKDIIVVDDVMTTGATLEAARKALLPHSPKSVTLVAMAH